MTTRRRMDPRLSLLSDAVVLAAAILLATQLSGGWSWPFFVWGALLGPAAAAFAYFSTCAFGAGLVRRLPGRQDAVRSRLRTLWHRQRLTYLAVVVFMLAVGVVAARTHGLAIDAIATVLWLATGVIPPLLMWPALRRRALRGSAGAAPGRRGG